MKFQVKTSQKKLQMTSKVVRSLFPPTKSRSKPNNVPEKQTVPMKKKNKTDNFIDSKIKNSSSNYEPKFLISKKTC